MFLLQTKKFITKKCILWRQLLSNVLIGQPEQKYIISGRPANGMHAIVFTRSLKYNPPSSCTRQ